MYELMMIHFPSGSREVVWRGPDSLKTVYNWNYKKDYIDRIYHNQTLAIL